MTTKNPDEDYYKLYKCGECGYLKISNIDSRDGFYNSNVSSAIEWLLNHCPKQMEEMAKMGEKLNEYANKLVEVDYKFEDTPMKESIYLNEGKLWQEPKNS